VIDLATRRPAQIGLSEDVQAHHSTFLDHLRAFAQAGTLWIFDRGFYDFNFFADLIEQGVAWITRLKSNAIFSVQQVLVQSVNVRDQIILLGGQTPCRRAVRLIEVRFGHT
jgi:hypothetical protein